MKSTLASHVPSGDSGGYHFDAESPTYIVDADVFWATVRHYATEHTIDAGHLADTLRMTLHHGEPVTAERVWKTAAALARGGYSRELLVGAA